MGVKKMINIFKKKPLLTLNAVAEGKAVSLLDVNDPTFSQKMVGEGIAIIQKNGQFVAPCDGVITMIFPTKHAFGLMTDNQVEILVHIGLDTVQVKGEGFTSHVSVNQRVKKGDLILEVDLNKIKELGYDTITPIVICNSDSFSKISPVLSGIVKISDPIIEIYE